MKLTKKEQNELCDFCSDTINRIHFKCDDCKRVYLHVERILSYFDEEDIYISLHAFHPVEIAEYFCNYDITDITEELVLQYIIQCNND